MAPKQHPLFILGTICTLLENDTGSPSLSSVLFNSEGYKVHHLSIWTLFLSLSHMVSSAGSSQMFVIKKQLYCQAHVQSVYRKRCFSPYEHSGFSTKSGKLSEKCVYCFCEGLSVAWSESARLWLWTHGFESPISHLLSIHAPFIYKYSAWQIWFLLPPIPVIHFLQLRGVGPLRKAWYRPPAALSTCLEFTSKIHLKHTIFPLENSELIYLQIPDELDMFWGLCNFMFWKLCFDGAGNVYFPE